MRQQQVDKPASQLPYPYTVIAISVEISSRDSGGISLSSAVCRSYPAAPAVLLCGSFPLEVKGVTSRSSGGGCITVSNLWRFFGGGPTSDIISFVSLRLLYFLSLWHPKSGSSGSFIFCMTLVIHWSSAWLLSLELPSIWSCKSTVFYRTPAPIIVYYFPYITCLLYLLFLIKHVRTSG